jgi:hypothetical protein
VNHELYDLYHLAAISTGSALRDWILIVVGNVFSAFLAARSLGHLLKNEKGEMITLFVSAVFVAALVWVPDQVRDVLIGIWDIIRRA